MFLETLTSENQCVLKSGAHLGKMGETSVRPKEGQFSVLPTVGFLAFLPRSPLTPLLTFLRMCVCGVWSALSTEGPGVSIKAFGSPGKIRGRRFVWGFLALRLDTS